MSERDATEQDRNAITTFAVIVAVLSVVSDGWAGKPSPLSHQLGLLPLAAIFFFTLSRLLFPGRETWQLPRLNPYLWVALFECVTWGLILAESRHFSRFGYSLPPRIAVAGWSLIAAGWLGYALRRTASALFWAFLLTFAASLLQAIRTFPLNYLRSDMLPVIGWADQRLLHHLNPYGTMIVGSRVYDFPYLPGVLLAFLPASALRIDLRFISLASLALASWLVFLSGRRARRDELAWVLGLFLLCPFLQYRHDLYLQPHWLSLAVAVLLMQRRHPLASTFVWGISCGIYQLSWVMVPFAVLFAYRSRGWTGALKQVGAGLLGMAVVVGPFMSVALHQVAHNTVGQWSQLPHALAEPINVSYWLTYLVRPDQLRWLQAVVLTLLFTACCWHGRCRTLPDTLRWMCCALAVFIPMNVLVDGYFYLTLLWMLVLYICAEREWWSEPQGAPLGRAPALLRRHA